MNLNDKTKSVTVRVTETEFAYIKECGELYHMTPSKFLRLVIDMTMRTTKEMGKTPKEINDEYPQAICDHLVQQ